MRRHARFCALVFVAFVSVTSADFNRALAQTPTPTPTSIQAGQVIISEFRLRGPEGVEDEFIELYNNTDSPIVVQAADASAGWTVAISNGQATGPLFTIPNGTHIPARGHYLGANQNGYSLCNYPSGYASSGFEIRAPSVPASACVTNGVSGTFTHTTPDRTWDLDVTDGSGIALFATTNGLNLTAATKLDAVGFSSSPAGFREGGGIATIVTTGLEHTYYRDLRGGLPRDTADNAADFQLVATFTNLQITRLGAPGPENLASPIVNNATITPTLLDPTVSSSTSPNRERTFTTEPNAPLGTLRIRRTITNNTGAPISRLRFRVVNMTTLGTPAADCGGTCADVRALTSQDEPAVATSQGPVVVTGLRLENDQEGMSPEHPIGGGYNASLSADFVTLGTPLPDTQSVNVVFKLGITRHGPFRFFLNIEAQNVSAPEVLGPADSSVDANGGTSLQRKKLAIDTVRSAPAGAAPASPAAAPATLYAPLFINLTPGRAAEDEKEKEEDKEEDQKQKSEEAPPSAEHAPQAPAAVAADAADAAAPQQSPAKTRRGAAKAPTAAAKARPRESQ